MAKEILFAYHVDDSDEYSPEDIDSVINSILRDLSSSDGPGQCVHFIGVREVES